MAYLSSLLARVNTVNGVLEKWEDYEADQYRQVESAGGKRVTFRDDFCPHFGNETVSYILHVIDGHRWAARQNREHAHLHADAVFAWRAAALAARNDSPRDKVRKLVDSAAQASRKAVMAERGKRK